jgi:tetratricopeptide (TPR) repeat protein
MSTRKRIELAVLALLAVVLGAYVYDRIGIRMGGTPSSFQSSYASEEDWMLDTILRDLAETAAYARGIPLDEVRVVAIREPTGPLTLPLVSVGVRVGDIVTISDRPLVLARSFWNPDNYAELAGELIGPSAASGSGTDVGNVLVTLLDPRPGVLVAESDRISARLTADIRDAGAHEEAALLLGVFGLREAAYGFDDKRFLLLRMTAHLAIARALDADGSSRNVRPIAEAALLALNGRQAELLESLDELPRNSDAAQTWRAALYMYATDDWRAPAPVESLLVRLMRFRATASALGSSNAIDRMGDAAAADRDLSDWGRILTWRTARDVATRGFIETQLGRELTEIGEVSKLMVHEAVRSPAELAEALNAMPERLVGSEGPRVLSRGLWAAFFQRQLCAALIARDEHLREALGVPDQAQAFGRAAERVFSSLAMNPIVQIHRTRYVGARVEDTVGMDDAIALTRRHPELVNPTQWRNLENTAGHMMRKRGMPAADSWLSANVLVTGLLDSTSARFEILERSIDPEQARDRLAELTPLDTASIAHTIHRLEGKPNRFAELSARLGARLDYDGHALRTLLDAAKTDTERLDVLSRLCDLDGNECDNLGWDLVDSGKTEQAVDAFQRMVDRAPNQVAACNNADWLVRYYFEHGRVVDAITVANRMAEVYCSWGLQTKAYLLERMGRTVEAEQMYLANQKRYDSGDVVSYPLFGFRYRMARVLGDKDYEPRFQGQLTKIFPRGLEPLPAEMEQAPGAPNDGVLIDGDSGTLKRAGLRGGDIIVGLDGWRVRSLEQYDAIRELRPRTSGARDGKLRVWRQAGYLDAETDSRRRRLYVKVRTLGTPGPSVEER